MCIEPFDNLLIGPARIGDYIQAQLVHLRGKDGEWLCLCERIASAQGYAREERIFFDLSDQIANLAVVAAFKIMRLWVLAAGADSMFLSVLSLLLC